MNCNKDNIKIVLFFAQKVFFDLLKKYEIKEKNLYSLVSEIC